MTHTNRCFSFLHIDVIRHHRLEALLLNSPVDFLKRAAVRNLKLLIALALAAVVADTGGDPCGNFRGGDVDDVVPEPGPLPGGDGDAGKGHKEPVGADHLEKLALVDVFGVDFVIVDNGAQPGAGEGNLCLGVLPLKQPAVKAGSERVFAEIVQPQQGGHKRIFPYRFNAQERALMGGMRGVGFSALLGLADFRKDALATGLHVYYLQRKYPHAEMSLSCPRLRPIINNDKINPRDVHERQLCQVLCAYRIFLPFAGITVSSRESAQFRNGIVKIAATKVSAGVSTGIGDHESKYTGRDTGGAEGDEQFEINDSRSFARMYDDISAEGLQPVLNDYLYV